MKTNYSLSVMWSEEDESFVALCPEFPGISAFGNTQTEAVKEIETALSASIELCKDEGEELPDARLLPEHSGQFRIRIPKYLHTSLVLEAERQGVSLNTLVQTYLAQSIVQSAAEDYITQLKNRFVGLCANVISTWHSAFLLDYDAVKNPWISIGPGQSLKSTIETSAFSFGDVKWNHKS